MDDALKALLEQEKTLQFASFDENTAWELGAAIVAEARKRALPVAIDIRRGERQIFHASLPGASADNDRWIERKVRTVNRVGHSSLYVAKHLASLGKTLSERYCISEEKFAAKGGGFPILVKGTGLVGTVAVSGLPHEDDHRLVTDCLAAVIRG